MGRFFIREAYKVRGHMKREDETKLILVLIDVWKESLIGRGPFVRTNTV